MQDFIYEKWRQDWIDTEIKYLQENLQRYHLRQATEAELAEVRTRITALTQAKRLP